MIGWLWRFIIGHFSRCDHKWKTIKEDAIYSSGIIMKAGERIGTSYVLRCDKCGDMKNFDN